jgi:hypothetical protein
MNGFIGAATLIVTVVGLWLAYNYRRQMALKLSETRLDAYSRLWEITGVAAPTRLDGWGDDGYLQLVERRELWAAITDWYYAKGGGMLLTAVTKEVYLNVKRNLVCEWSELCPAHLAARIELPADHELVDKVRGILAIKLISLLRTQLKSDLTIYGPTYAGKLNNYERFFLEQSGVNLRSRAWAKAAGYSWWGRVAASANGRGQVAEREAARLHRAGLAAAQPVAGKVGGPGCGRSIRTPASSRIAMENALRSGSAGSAGARGGIPEVHSDDRDASIGLNTLP